MSAGQLDIVLEPGADFEEILSYELADASGAALNFASGWTAAAQVRHHFADASPALTLTVVISVAGQITISALAADTEDLQSLFRKGRWDLELTKTSGGDKIRLLEGAVKVKPQVTQ